MTAKLFEQKVDYGTFESAIYETLEDYGYSITDIINDGSKCDEVRDMAINKTLLLSERLKSEMVEMAEEDYTNKVWIIIYEYWKKFVDDNHIDKRHYAHL